MPAVVTKNLREMQVTPDTGKDVRDTQVVSGQASRTKAEDEVNSTVQYTTSGGANRKGPLGGEASNA